jgi:conserved oligomeric Golgi complex subunit 8
MEELPASLAALRREPARLQAVADRLAQQQRDAAVEHYRVFLENAESARGLRDAHERVRLALDGGLEELPVLDARCRGFLQAIERIAAARKANSLLLQYHPALLELLELPQLMDTCVRNGYYEEALDLAAHVERLALRSSSSSSTHGDNAVLATVVAEVDRAAQLMLTQLVGLLHGEAKVGRAQMTRVVRRGR